MAYRDIDEMRNVDPRTVDRRTLVERAASDLTRMPGTKSDCGSMCAG